MNSFSMKPNVATALRCPRFWLALQLAAAILAAGCCGLWKVEISADTESYIVASQATWAEAMVGPRTLGYPLLLRAVDVVSPDYHLMPFVHLAMLAGAVFLFDFSLRRFGVSPWVSLAISSAIIYAALPWRTPVAFLLADFPAMTLAVATVACLLWVVAERRRILPWLGLTTCLAAAYQMRPAYLFLVPLVPCLGVAFVFLWSKGRGAPRIWKGLSVGLLAAAALPLLGYCLLRLKMVGDFGLVNFAGYNLSGLAVELLDEPMIDGELSPHFRPFAREIMAERHRLGMTAAFGPGLRVSLQQYEANFSGNIYHVALPAARRIYGSDPVACNRQMAHFSREVIGLRKGWYLLWAAESLPRAVMKILWFQWILWVLVPVAVVLPAVRLGMWRRREKRKDIAAGVIPHVLWLLAALAVAYFLAYMALMCLSGSYGDSRLVVPAGVFLPSLLAMVIVGQWEKIRLFRLMRPMFRILITDASSKHCLPLQRHLRATVGHRVDWSRYSFLSPVQALRLSRRVDPPGSAGRGRPAGTFRHDHPGGSAGGGHGGGMSCRVGGPAVGGEPGMLLRQVGDVGAGRAA